MSREEIVNHIAYHQEIAAFEYANLHFDNINKISERNAAYNGFEAGAEWMQETMIEKARQWFNLHFRQVGTPKEVKHDFQSKEKMWKSFTQFMEE